MKKEEDTKSCETTFRLPLIIHKAHGTKWFYINLDRKKNK